MAGTHFADASRLFILLFLFPTRSPHLPTYPTFDRLVRRYLFIHPSGTSLITTLARGHNFHCHLDYLIVVTRAGFCWVWLDYALSTPAPLTTFSGHSTLAIFCPPTMSHRSKSSLTPSSSPLSSPHHRPQHYGHLSPNGSMSSSYYANSTSSLRDPPPNATPPGGRSPSPSAAHRSGDERSEGRKGKGRDRDDL